jgi:SNF2 family DNA or RNA helicase
MCDTEKWGYVSFNGKMTLEAREKAIENFRDKESISIMICSLRAGGIGLNLTMASKVIILDLWFNSSVEAQAYCRAFRIGQDKKVEVVRFVVKDSIDEDLIKMQDRKDVEVSGAIGPDSHGKRATIQQLLELFGSVQEEDDGQNEFILMEDEGESDDDENVDMSERLPPRPF